MAMPTFTMRQLLEAGTHFGHRTRRWNPKVSPYLFGSRGGIHIIDLQQTVPMLHTALHAIRNVVAEGGKVLFVGTKRQAAGKVKEAAELCGQYYVNHRWLGGMLTNWKTVSKSITRLNELDEQLNEESAGFTKKELLKLTREREKLDLTLGGIRDMNGTPSILFVIDTNKEEIAIKEANRLGIPVVAVVDSNSSPESIDYIIPGNDDATRAIELYCNLVSASVLDGLQAQLQSTGGDAGAAEEVVVDIAEDELVEVEVKEKPAKKAAAKKPAAKKEEAAEEKAKEKPKKAPAKKAAPKKEKASEEKAEEKPKKAPAKKAKADEDTKEAKPAKKAAAKKPAAKKTATKKKDETSEAAEA